MKSIIRHISGTDIVKIAFWSAFWFCFFFGPLWYLLPMAGFNAWWTLPIACIGAGVYVLKVAALIWFDGQERAAA